MPPVELATLTNAVVELKASSANGAAVLQVSHAVPADSPLILAEGSEVLYTDPEIGLQFRGKVTTIEPNFGSGEGVKYICADAYRTLVKTPGYITGQNGKQSAKVKFNAGSKMKTVLNALLDELPLTTLFPGGVDLTALSDPDIPVTDKGGQYLDSWIDDLLENTEGGFALVEYDAAGDAVLKFDDFYAQPAVELTIGDFSVVQPGAVRPLMEQANAGKTLDRKFKKTAAEGCGDFVRRTDVYIAGVGTPLLDAFNSIRYKFTFPEKRVTGRFLDSDGKCRDIFIMKFEMGLSSGQTFTYFFIHPANFLAEETDGQMFAAVDVRRGGLTSATEITTVQAWFTYTAYLGPLRAEKVSSDPALDNEGDFWEDHPEFVKFSGDTNVDDTPKLQAIADNLHKRFSELPDLSGSIRIHVQGINPDLKIGSVISNAEFSGARVHHLDVDYVERSMILDVSTLPIRETFELFKRQLQQRTVERGGWFQNRSNLNTTNCFCGGAVFQDAAGGGLGGLPSGGGGGDGANQGTSWDCIQCHCMEQNNDNGQFQTEQDCLAVCRDANPAGYTFEDCVGCVCSMEGGQFATLAECEAANPNPVTDAGCDFICTEENGCQAVSTGVGQYGSLAACQAACEGGGGTGSGDDGTSHSLGSGSAPISSTSLTPIDPPTGSGPCGGTVSPQTFNVAAPSFIGASSETPVVTLVKTVETDSCGRVITVTTYPEFTILPKWQ